MNQRSTRQPATQIGSEAAVTSNGHGLQVIDVAAIMERLRDKWPGIVCRDEQYSTGTGLLIEKGGPPRVHRIMPTGACVTRDGSLISADKAARLLGTAKPPPARPQTQVVIGETAEQSYTTGHDLTDLGNAGRFVALNSDDVHHCAVWNKWFVYDGSHWVEANNGEVERKAKAAVRSIALEAFNAPDEPKRAALLKHHLRSQSASGIANLIKLAESEPGVAVKPEDFDRDIHLFNLLNGTFNLQTFQLCPHRRDDLITKLAPVAYDPAAECPLWTASLERWQRLELSRRFLQEIVGISLCGDTIYQIWLFLFGEGRNGKSTFLGTIEETFGHYWHKATATTFMLSRNNDGNSDKANAGIMDLRGCRLATVQELDKGQKFNSALIKDVTGGDAITSRRPFDRSTTTFKPQFTLWMMGNSKPRVNDTSEGMWRRLRLVPFTECIPESEIDRALPDKLRQEKAGIFNWAVEGLRRVKTTGLSHPDEVKEATRGYSREQDIVAQFIDEVCIVAQTTEERGTWKETAKELFSRFRQWCEGNNEMPGPQRDFGGALRAKGFGHKRGTGGAYVWWGIRFRTENDPIDSDRAATEGQSEPPQMSIDLAPEGELEEPEDPFDGDPED